MNYFLRNGRRVLFVILTSAFSASCAQEDMSEARNQRATATVEDIMQFIIDPAADAIWDAVITDVTVDGIVEIFPTTDSDWEMLRQKAVTLAEATNLLLVKDRRIAGPQSRSELPGVDLHPNAIQLLLEDNQIGWDTAVRELLEASLEVINSVNARSINELLVAGTALDTACETCHTQFWYPGYGDPRPDESGP